MGPYHKIRLLWLKIKVIVMQILGHFGSSIQITQQLSGTYCLLCFVIWILLPQSPSICIILTISMITYFQQMIVIAGQILAMILMKSPSNMINKSIQSSAAYVVDLQNFTSKLISIGIFFLHPWIYKTLRSKCKKTCYMFIDWSQNSFGDM